MSHTPSAAALPYDVRGLRPSGHHPARDDLGRCGCACALLHRRLQLPRGARPGGRAGRRRRPRGRGIAHLTGGRTHCPARGWDFHGGQRHRRSRHRRLPSSGHHLGHRPGAPDGCRRAGGRPDRPDRRRRGLRADVRCRPVVGEPGDPGRDDRQQCLRLALGGLGHHGRQPSWSGGAALRRHPDGPDDAHGRPGRLDARPGCAPRQRRRDPPRIAGHRGPRLAADLSTLLRLQTAHLGIRPGPSAAKSRLRRGALPLGHRRQPGRPPAGDREPGRAPGGHGAACSGIQRLRGRGGLRTSRAAARPIDDGVDQRHAPRPPARAGASCWRRRGAPGRKVMAPGRGGGRRSR